MKIKKNALLLIANKKIKLISDEYSKIGLMFEVQSDNLNEVRIYPRNGKIFINDGCTNSIRYGVNNFNICKHKLGVLFFIWKDMLFEKFNPIYKNIFLKAFELVLTESVIFYEKENKFIVNGKELNLIKGKRATYLSEPGEKEPELTPEKIACLIKLCE